MDGQSERRVITALYIDVVGSTDLMMRVGPEVMRRRLADAFSQMNSRITEQGGTVENYAGDAVFAIFGAPTARIDDVERALRAAQACAEWSKVGLGDERMSIRVGIETGEALVDVEAVARHDRMAIGAAVNTAARLQQQADPGEIVVGPTAHAAAADVARFEPLGTIELKGLGALEAWRFVDFAAAVEVVGVPFVGRRSELETLSGAADRSAAGQPTLALIVGPPGQGKSRLVGELALARQKSGNVRVIEIRCRPSGEEGNNTPLRQLVDADVQQATPDAVRERLTQLLGADAAAPVARAVLHSTGLETSAELLAITRYEQRANIAEAWRRYLSAMASERPLIVTVEDVHWADPVIVFTLYHVTSSGDAPLLVLATARPEFAGSPLIRPGEGTVQIDLDPLDADAANELARAARGTVAGLDRAAGNPLFIIELARAQSGQAATGGLPLTIQAAIAARLDELSPDERQLLQQVSVAGETFDVRDAALLTDRSPAEVAGMLGRIAHLGFVEFDGHAYRFHHALVRDVAYSRLPVSNRLQLHARYADEGVPPTDALARAFHLWEAVKPPDADWVWEDAARLAGMRAAAFDAQLAAGDELASWNQYEQAEEVYKRAVELAGDEHRRGGALTALGKAQARLGNGDDAWATRLAAINAYAEAGSTAPSPLYADMLEIATFNYGYFHDLPDDSDVLRLLDEGQHIARSTGDDVALARLLMEKAMFTADPAGTQEVLGFLGRDDAVRFADAGHRTAQILMWSGEFDKSLALYRRVFDELLPLGAVINEPEALVWNAIAAFFRGDLELALTLRDRSIADLAKGRSVHTQSHVFGVRSLVAFGLGDWSGLLAVTEEFEALLSAHPDDSFCLIGGSAVGFGGAARLHAGLDLPSDVAAHAARMIEGSELIQASSILLPQAMLGDLAAVDRGLAAYAAGVRLFDRASISDTIHLLPAIAAVMTQRWDMLEAPIARMEHCAAGGSWLAEAVLEAVREERAGESRHEKLRGLGYVGISELLRTRASDGVRA